MIICIQCAMEAMIAGQQYTGSHDATPELHMKRVHPDPQVTQARRVELERQIATLIEMGQGLMRDSEPHTVSDTLANDENDPVGRLHTRILMGALYRAQDGSTGRVMGVSGHPTIADEVLVAVDHGKTIQTFTGADFRAQYTLFKVVQ